MSGFPVGGSSLLPAPEPGHSLARKFQTARSSDYHTTGKRVEMAELPSRALPHIEGGGITGRQEALLRSLQSRDVGSGEKMKRMAHIIEREGLPQQLFDELGQYAGNPEKMDEVLRKLQELPSRGNPGMSDEARKRQLREQLAEQYAAEKIVRDRKAAEKAARDAIARAEAEKARKEAEAAEREAAARAAEAAARERYLDSISPIIQARKRFEINARVTAAKVAKQKAYYPGMGVYYKQ